MPDTRKVKILSGPDAGAVVDRISPADLQKFIVALDAASVAFETLPPDTAAPAAPGLRVDTSAGGASENALAAIRGGRKDEEEVKRPPGNKTTALMAALLGAGRAASREHMDEAAGVGAVVADVVAGAPDVATPRVMPMQREPLPGLNRTSRRGIDAPLDRLQNFGGEDIAALEDQANLGILPGMRQLAMQARTMARPNAYVEGREQQRELQDTAEQEHFWPTMGGMFAGGMLTTPGVGPQMGASVVQRLGMKPRGGRMVEGLVNLLPQAVVDGALSGMGATRGDETRMEGAAGGAAGGAVAASVMGVGGEAAMTPLRALGARKWDDMIRPSSGGTQGARIANMVERVGGGPVTVGPLPRVNWTAKLRGETFDETAARVTKSQLFGGEGRKELVTPVVGGMQVPKEISKIEEEFMAQVQKDGGTTNILEYVSNRVSKQITEAVAKQHSATVSKIGRDKKQLFSSSAGKVKLNGGPLLEEAQELIRQLFIGRGDGSALDHQGIVDAEKLLANFRGKELTPAVKAKKATSKSLAVAEQPATYKEKRVTAEDVDILRAKMASVSDADSTEYSGPSKDFAKGMYGVIRHFIDTTPELNGLKKINKEAEEALGPLHGALSNLGFSGKQKEIESGDFDLGRTKIGEVIATYMIHPQQRSAMEYMLRSAPEELKLLEHAAGLRDWLSLADGQAGLVVRPGLSARSATPYGTVYVSPGKWQARAAGLERVTPGVPGRSITSSFGKLLETIDSLAEEDDEQ